jgi:hypothetical protein
VIEAVPNRVWPLLNSTHDVMVTATVSSTIPDIRICPFFIIIILKKFLFCLLDETEGRKVAVTGKKMNYRSQRHFNPEG